MTKSKGIKASDDLMKKLIRVPKDEIEEVESVEPV